MTATFDTKPAPPGTGSLGSEAVVHGMLATLAEVLDRLDSRLAGVEARLAELETPAENDEVRGLHRGFARLEATLAEARAEAGVEVRSLAERVEALGGVADRVAQLHEAVNRSRGEATAAVEQVGDSLAERFAGLEAAMASLGAVRLHGSDDVPGLQDVLERLARVEVLVQQHGTDQEARLARLTAEVQSVLGAGMERLLTHAGAADELVASDLRSSLQRLGEVAAAVGDIGASVTAVHDQLGRLTAEERTRPLLTAMETSSQEHREAMAELQTALVRRIDARTSALARLVDGNAIFGGEVGPLLQRLSTAVDEQDGRARELADLVRGVPTSVEEQLGSLREDLEQTVTGMTRRQSATLKLLERLGAELGDEHRRLEAVQALCQSVASAVEQQAAVGGRVAELVLETRSVMRGDLERIESTVHLEAVKGRQQDQARLAQLTASVTDVVEREASLVAQRVGALSSAVESVRTAMHAQAVPAVPEG